MIFNYTGESSNTTATVSTGTTTGIQFPYVTVDTITTGVKIPEIADLTTLPITLTPVYGGFNFHGIGYKNVEIIADKDDNARVVKVTFGDDDVQKAICSEEDDFNLEYGITICLVKHLLKMVGSSSPTKDLSKAISKAIDLYEKKQIDKLNEEAKKQQIEYRRAKRAEKKRRRKERKEAEEKAKAIDIQAEAFLRAMRTYNAEFNERRADDLK